MSIYKQSVNQHFTSSPGSISLSGVTAGNVLSLQVFWYTNQNTNSGAPTDSSGQTWSQNEGYFGNIPGGYAGAYIWLLPNANAGTHTLSFVFSGSASPTCYATLTEWPATSVTGIEDAYGQHTGGTTQTATCLATTNVGGSFGGVPQSTSEIVLATIAIGASPGLSNIALQQPSGSNWDATGFFTSSNDNSDIGGTNSWAYSNSWPASQLGATWTWTDGTSGTQTHVAAIMSIEVPALGGGGPIPPIIYTKRNVIQLDQTIYY